MLRTILALIGRLAAAIDPVASGAALLRRELRAHGVAPGSLPTPAVRELSEESLRIAKVMARASAVASMSDHADWRVNFVKLVESNALVVSLILAGDRSRLAEDGAVRELLVRHGVEVPARRP